jgi:hypothetical protein
MAVALLIEIPGMTQAQSNAVFRDLNLGGRSPAGQVLHCEGVADDGLFRVVDVWESMATYEAFVQQRLMPLFQRHGVTGQPKVTTFEVHNMVFGDRP